jgi:exodeoxyribonuclease VII small subunit
MSKSKQSTSSGKANRAQGSEAEPSELSFEGALEQLETTVARLEEGEMPLEEALELFETGVKLSRQCSSTLEAAEKRIEVLVADRDSDDEWESEPFETEELEEDD